MQDVDTFFNEPQETPAQRLEWLTGRFIDGALREEEDRELVALLETEPAKAQRFLRQMEFERLLSVITDPQRMSDGVFNQAVQRSVHLLNDRDGNERFARNVVSLVRGQRLGSVSGTHQSVRRRTAMARRAALFPWVAAAGLAATIALVVILAWPDSSTPTTASVDTPPNLEHIQLARTQVIDLAHTDLRAPGLRVPAEDSAPAYTFDFPTYQAAQTPEIQSVPAPQVARTPAPPTVVPLPAPTPVPAPAVAVVPPVRPDAAQVLAIDEIGRVKPAVGCSAVIRRANTETDLSVRRVELLGEGDLLRVGMPESSYTDPKLAQAGTEILLKDGTTLFLRPGTHLRLQRADGAVRAVLEQGDVLARVMPQPADKPLAIQTVQGPEAKVLGTVLRVQADAQSKRVNLFVEEGKVQFTNKGESRIVVADESSFAEEGKAPVLPFLYRPRPGTLAGMVADREKNAPAANALVIASPVAQGSGPLLQFKARTDAQGKYQFDALPEGPVFVYVVTEEGESRGIRGRGSVARARVASNEKTNFNVMLDKAMLVEGRVTDNGKALSDYRVRLVRVGGDGLSFNAAQSGTIKWLTGGDGMDGFTFVALEGAGRYAAIVEKKGFIARVRSGAMNDLRPDRVTQWFIDASFTPSAIIRGQVGGPTGTPIPEDAGTKSDDPKRTRTVATLKGSSGPVMQTVAEPDGSFAFDTNLESGVFELRVERYGYQTDTRRVTVAAGKTLDVQVNLKPQPIYRKQP